MRFAYNLSIGDAANEEAVLKIPFNRPVVAGREFEHIGEAIALGQLAGDGAFTDRCQRWLEAEIGCGAALLTHSCTAALGARCDSRSTSSRATR